MIIIFAINILFVMVANIRIDNKRVVLLTLFMMFVIFTVGLFDVVYDNDAFKLLKFFVLFICIIALLLLSDKKELMILLWQD